MQARADRDTDDGRGTGRGMDNNNNNNSLARVIYTERPKRPVSNAPN